MNAPEGRPATNFPHSGWVFRIMGLSQNTNLHVWFSDGWQLHFFGHLQTAVVMPPSGQGRRKQLDEPEAKPYAAAVCMDAKLAEQCMHRMGRPPWELLGQPSPVKNPLPTIEKFKWSEGKAG